MKYTGERIIPELPECRPGTLIYDTHIAAYQFATPYVAGRRVLDLACGVGYGSYFLANHGARTVVGGDIAPEAIAYALEHYSAANTQYAVMGADELPLPSASIDVAVSFETLEHVPSADRFLGELRRVLLPGGQVVISTPNRITYGRGSSTPDNTFHTREYTIEEFQELLDRFFVDTTLFSQRKRRRHSALAGNVDALARHVRTADRLRLRRLVPRTLRSWLTRATDAFDTSPIIVPMQPGDDPLIFVAVAHVG